MVIFSVSDAHRCRICTELAGIIETTELPTLLTQKSSVIESVCVNVPSEYQSRCSDSASDILNAMITKIQQGFEAKTVCNDTCAGSEHRHGFGENWNCWMCQAAMTVCERYSGDESQAFVLEHAQYLCGMLSTHKEQVECNFTMMYLVGAVYAGANPNSVCAQFHQCNASASFHEHKLKSLKAIVNGSANDCDACRMASFLTRVASKSNDASAETVSDRLKDLCVTYGAECDSVLKIIPTLVDQINQGTRKVCMNAGICAESDCSRHRHNDMKGSVNRNV